MTRIAVSLLIACLVVACGGASTAPGTPASPSPAIASTAPSTATAPASAAPSSSASGRPSTGDPVADARLADLDHLVARLKRIHRNPFLEEGEAGFMARVAAIEAKVGTLTDIGFLVEVMRLMGARDRDGHSGAWSLAQPGSLLKSWPIWLYDFPDGLRIVAARAPYEDLVGARITKIGHAPIADARAAVAPLAPRDNPSHLRLTLPMYLTLPDVLAELGLIADGEAGLTVEMPDGSTREVTPEALPIETVRDWIFGVYDGGFPEYLPPDPDGPLPLRNQGVSFWSMPLADPAGFYVGYNEVRRTGSDGANIGDLAKAVLAAAEADPGAPVVVDLRNNGGGDNTTFSAFRQALDEIAEKHPGSVRLITGRATFSAAGNFVTDLKTGRHKDGIVLVGEPPGGGLNIYGDVDVVTLPNSKVVVLISADYHERAPDDERLQIEPDVPIELTWADYAAGRDPVLDAARRP